MSLSFFFFHYNTVMVLFKPWVVRKIIISFCYQFNREVVNKILNRGLGQVVSEKINYVDKHVNLVIVEIRWSSLLSGSEDHLFPSTRVLVTFDNFCATEKSFGKRSFLITRVIYTVLSRKPKYSQILVEFLVYCLQSLFSMCFCIRVEGGGELGGGGVGRG